MGRVLRSKYDYGLMVFADKRFSRADKQDKLPNWIRNLIESRTHGISVDMAVQLANSFFKEMGQPFKMPDSLLLGQEELNRRNLADQQ